MSLRLADHWIWDFWLAEDGDDVHVFYLHAPRAIGHPDLRHSHAQVGHAVSQDLRTWETLPTALSPGPPGAFDDLATWTGSVLAVDGRWLMFYSGISTRDDGAVQRIGLATSDDLLRWEKQDLLLEADPRWYEKLSHGGRDEAWRDPWVFRDDATGAVHLLVTARANYGPLDGRGVIGHAWSPDLRSWEIGPPLSAPGEFHHLEVPQLVHVGGAWRILFSANQDDHSAARLARPGVVADGGIHYLTAAEQLGPYHLERDAFLLGQPPGRYYAGRLIRHFGAWQLLAWRNTGDGGHFIGELGDPMPLTIKADRSLSIQLPVPTKREPAEQVGRGGS